METVMGKPSNTEDSYGFIVFFLLALNVGLLDGLLGVAGMVLKLVTGIIPENSLRKTHIA